MRELKVFEVEEVSGSGVVADASAIIGTGVGMLLGSILGNTNEEITKACNNIGGGLGLIAEKTMDKLSVLGKKAIKFFFW